MKKLKLYLFKISQITLNKKKQYHGYYTKLWHRHYAV